MAQTVATQIKSTTDYEVFKQLPGNRQPKHNHVQGLVRSFEANPNLLSIRPVLVNEKMEVVDGQHTLRACEALGWPVYYMQVDGLDLGAAQLLNANQKAWTMMDFANSYAFTGNVNYQKLLDMVEEYQINPSILAVYLSDSRRFSGGRHFRRGEFVVTNEAHAKEWVEMLSDFADITPHWKRESFGIGFWRLVRTPGYDHQRMLNGATKIGIKRQGSREEYVRELERAYNFGHDDDVRFE